ncbi:hypothetical protein B0J11DRAFT_557260 [Dendryphion nanum]|uniref:Zn(2)-C6 fungal-type domain-containing protein n=1 Tax=Dendryphion nanum TaxID=256645 RepID=A0A9P9ITC0_9PLEO|nr:hypothetical protein B0J11DRAFT_557260 [Dendryphion nanum]
MAAHGNDIIMQEVYPSTETGPAHDSMSPTKSAHPKHISFVLLLPQSPQHRARLPMRVNIFPHDTTDSIITTVKNFYGLYERRGVVFEDQHGTTLIARYENFEHNMVVYVRITPEDPDVDEFSPDPRQSTSPRRPRLGDAFQMLPPALNPAQGGRSGFHIGARQSQSPQPGRGRRSASASTNNRSRGRPSAKSRGTSSHGSFADLNGDNFSDSDSVTSSRRGRKEQVASADISVDNIVEGGRRKRAKFDSSRLMTSPLQELPLFVPPQVPMTASLSSVSPQRRISSQNGASPYSITNQQTFTFSQPLPSPQSYGHGEVSYLHGLATPYTNSSAQGQRSRARGSGQYSSYRLSGNSTDMMPTPDLTMGSVSVISDEDVARQLMRLGDASNFSTHGRTSTSTLDDALSGKADAASSSEESEEGSDDDEQELPPLPYNQPRINGINGVNGVHSVHGVNGDATRGFDSVDTSGDEYEDNKDGSFKGLSDDVEHDEQGALIAQNGSTKARSSTSGKSAKPSKPRALSKTKTKTNSTSKPPMSPTSLPPQSRKPSTASLNFQHPLGADEEDLSSKPRCQRCRKSKKGCDRQRPCGRCKDAGIGIEGCVSEDEGNGRKGRYGRHMGVPVKKGSAEDLLTAATAFPGTMPHTHAPSVAAGVQNVAMDKSKKRKR